MSAETASGARTVIFGTSVVYRTHPKGGMSQAGRAILWSAPAGDKVMAPEEAEATALTATSAGATYPASPEFAVSAASAAGTPTGTVEILIGEAVVGEAELTDGVATVTIDQQVPARYTAVARFSPDSEAHASATSDPVDFRVKKAVSDVSLELGKIGKIGKKGLAKVKVTAALEIVGLAPQGTVVIKEGKRTLRSMSIVAEDGTRTVKLRLEKGRHTLRVVHPGTALAKFAKSGKVSFQIR